MQNNSSRCYTLAPKVCAGMKSTTYAVYIWQVQAADVRTATELVQAHAGEMSALLDANATAQQRMQQLEMENSGLHAKLARAEDCLDGMRHKFKYVAHCVSAC